MYTDPQSHDAAEIIRGLSSLPGGISVQVTAKRFPRRGPAEPGTGYVQQEQSFDLHHLPDHLPIPQGMDEIVITMQGALEGEASTLGLLTNVNGVLESVPTHTCWEARTFLAPAQTHPRPYKINLFTELFGSAPRV